MSVQEVSRARQLRVIVVGNEKGGSGKSTVAMHVAVALMNAGHRVATIDLDARQRSFTHYIENRLAWAQRRGRNLPTPDHFRFDDIVNPSTAEDEAEASKILCDALDTLAQTYEFIVIDTPGHDGYVMRLAHAMADTLITPLNDSFVDVDVLASVDPESFDITGASHYAEMIREARSQRLQAGQGPIDWVVLRNRLSVLGSRNKRLVGDSLQELSLKLDFRCIEGLAERVIFREFYLRGLTALDEIDETTLGARPTLSHITARQEVENLLNALRLEDPMAQEQSASPNRDAA
jgi:chromosome partitioning protein